MVVRRLAVALLLAAPPLALLEPQRAAAAPAVPRFSHVMEVFLENENATSTWEDASAAPHLAAIKAGNTYIPNFFGVGHASLDNYEAAFGAVEPTAQGKADCAGMPYGSCVFPASVPTIGGLFDDAGISWKVYSEGMHGAPGGGNCLHAVDRNAADFYQGPGTNGYATRHNPAPWFDSILTKGGTEDYCKAHSVDLTVLDNDLSSPGSLPTFSFIEPDTCHDGHDTSSIGGCAADPEGPGAPAGVAAMDAWLPRFISKVTSSPAWDDHSLLFITLDEGAATDTSGCAPCHDASAGGRIGAVVISALAKPGVSTWQGDHYGFLRTIESAYGLPTLATKAGVPPAGVTIHDGDAGVTPLTDIWTTGVAGTATTGVGSAEAATVAATALPATGADVAKRLSLGLWAIVAGATVLAAAIQFGDGRRGTARSRPGDR